MMEGVQSNSTFLINNITGTSMASPQVAGMLSLYLEKYPNLNHEDVSNISKSKIRER